MKDPAQSAFSAMPLDPMEKALVQRFIKNLSLRALAKQSGVVD